MRFGIPCALVGLLVLHSDNIVAALTMAAATRVDAVVAERLWFTELPASAPVSPAPSIQQAMVSNDGVATVAAAARGLYCLIDPRTGRTSNATTAIDANYRGRVGIALGQTNIDPAVEMLLIALDSPLQSLVKLISNPFGARQVLGFATVPGFRKVGMADVHGGDGNDELVFLTDAGITVLAGNGRPLFTIPTAAPPEDVAFGNFRGGGGADQIVVTGPNDLAQLFDGNQLVARGNAFGGATMNGMQAAVGQLSGTSIPELFFLAGAGAPPELTNVLTVFDIAAGPTKIVQSRIENSSGAIAQDMVVIDSNGDGIAELFATFSESEDERNWVKAASFVLQNFLAPREQWVTHNPFGSGISTAGIGLAGMLLVAPDRRE